MAGLLRPVTDVVRPVTDILGEPLGGQGDGGSGSNLLGPVTDVVGAPLGGQGGRGSGSNLLAPVTDLVGAPLGGERGLGSVTAVLSPVTDVVGGVVQSVSGGQKSHGSTETTQGPDPANDPRLAKFALSVHCDAKSSARQQVHAKQVVLRKGKLYLDNPDPAMQRFTDGHPFAGFYLELRSEHHPRPLGLVSTINQDPSELNWIYADRDTLELKYGNRTRGGSHIFAPWDWTDDKQGLTLEGWEGFVALEEKPGVWVLCYDKYDDHLREIRGRRRVLECSLDRRILRR